MRAKQSKRLFNPFSVVGIQHVDHDNKLFLLKYNDSSIYVDRIPIPEQTLSHSEAAASIKELLDQCPVIDNDPIVIRRASMVEIPSLTRRGAGSRYGNIIAYVGKSAMDAGIIVIERVDGTYSIYARPDYQNYYRVIKTNG